MSLKNILVAYNGTPSSQVALTYAASMARFGGAHVTALVAHAAHENYAAQSRWIPQDAREIIERANSETVNSIKNAFAAQQDQLRLGERLSMQIVGGRVDAVVAQCARGYDLLVTGEAGESAVDDHVVTHPDQIALQSGRPLLIVPQGYDAEASFSYVVVAWDGRRAAARALADAIQLLEEGSHVTLLTIGDQALARPIEEVLTHLSRHGIAAAQIHLPGGKGTAASIIGHCREAGPDLLVMGAYEHSKFRVDLLGGVTPAVVKGCPTPVLMSH